MLPHGGDALAGHSRPGDLAAAQEPFAIVLGCSDSRVPPEIVFDQGLGDLFVLRVAGNVVTPSQLASIEFALEQFGSPLVVVLGHSKCAAVLTTLDELEHPDHERSSSLRPITERIRPAVEGLVKTGFPKDRAALVESAVRENIAAATMRLRNGSRIIEQCMRNDGLLVVGAEYSLETGVVDFFDGLPGT